MLNINLICVGKCKQSYLQQACAAYQKRLGAFCRLKLVEVPEYKLPAQPSDAQVHKGLDQESYEVVKHIHKGYCYALCVEGKQMDSVAFAAHIHAQAMSRGSTIHFVIGSSHGLSADVKQKADCQFSISPMTFPHQMVRMLLLEQLYRSFQIQSNGKYHK